MIFYDSFGVVPPIFSGGIHVFVFQQTHLLVTSYTSRPAWSHTQCFLGKTWQACECMILARCLLCFVGTHKTTFCWLPCWIIRSMFLSPGVLILFKLHWGCLLINMSSFLLDTLIVCFQMSKVYLVSQFLVLTAWVLQAMLINRHVF